METNNLWKDDTESVDKIPESDTGCNQEQKPSYKSSKPFIAGILLIIAGLTAIVSWIFVITTDVSTIDISMFQEFNPTITAEQIQDFLVICGTVGCVLSIFPILGGIVALKRKIWILALIGSIIGLFTIGPFLASSVLSLIGLIIIAISREEFQ